MATREEECGCEFPSCPSGIRGELFDERHMEIKKHLGVIEDSQKEVIGIIRNVASLLANVESINKDLTRNETAHNDMFARLRIVEHRVMWAVGSLTSIVAILEVLRAVNVVK